MENKKYIIESLGDRCSTNVSNSNDIFLEGCFTSFGKLNRNKRIYDSKNFLEKLHCLDEKIQNHELLGELEHPAQMRYTSYQNVSHVIERLEYDEATDSISGRIKLLNTPSGRIARTLVENNIPLHISSRALGSLTPDNHVVVEELITYDLVAEPGFVNAVLHTVNEGKNTEYSQSVIEAITTLDNIHKTKVDAVTESLEDVTFYEVANTSVNDEQEEISKSKSDKNMEEHNEYQESQKEDFVTNESLENYTKYISKYLKKQREAFVTNESLENYTKYVSEHLKKQKEDFVTNESLEKYSEYMSKQFASYVTAMNENLGKLEKENKMLVEKLESLKQYADYISESQTKINKNLNGKYEMFVEASDKTFDELNSKIALQAEQPAKSEDTDLQNLVESVNTMVDSIKKTNSEIEAKEKIIVEAKEISEENKLVDYMPDYLKESWTKLSDNRKKEILKESKMYVLMTPESKMDFWKTRNMSEVNAVKNVKAYVSESLRNNNVAIRNDNVQASIADEIKRRLTFGF